MNLGIFSISHKIELKEFHDFELHYKGDAGGLLKNKALLRLYYGYRALTES
jgi:hypothetical protein